MTGLRATISRDDVGHANLCTLRVSASPGVERVESRRGLP